jgi:hypothetical protein
MPRPKNARTKASYLVSIDQIPGYAEYWSTCSGLEDTAGSGDTYSDGITRNLLRLPGVREISTPTLTKPYDVVADKVLMQWWDNWCEGEQAPTRVTIQPVFYCNDQPEIEGEPFVLEGCRPTRFKPPEGDKKSSDVSMIELDLTVDRIIYP